jgi:hypothetical protein
MMGRRFTRGGMMSMMDTPELRGLAAFMRRGHWLRDDDGHPGGGDAGEDHPDDPGADGDADDDGDEGEDEDGEGDGDDDKKDDDTDDDDKPKYSTREYDKIKRRMQGADKAKNDALKKLADLQKNGSAELDKQVKAEIDDLRPKAERLQKDNANLRLQLAFVNTRVKGVEWVDPDAALRLIDLSDVDVDPETGAIDKRDLAAAARRLAKEKPFLVKKAATSGGTDNNDQNGAGSSSGAPMNSTRKGRKKDTTSRAQLAARFPVLNQFGNR